MEKFCNKEGVMAKNINKMLKQAQKMQAQLMKAQEDLNNEVVEGTAGGDRFGQSLRSCLKFNRKLEIARSSTII